MFNVCDCEQVLKNLVGLEVVGINVHSMDAIHLQFKNSCKVQLTLYRQNSLALQEKTGDKNILSAIDVVIRNQVDKNLGLAVQIYGLEMFTTVFKIKNSSHKVQYM